MTTLAAAATLTLGLHLASVHVPAREHQHNVNPGVYLRVDSGAAQGLTLGTFRNSLGRSSIYAGHTSRWPIGSAGLAVDVTLGAVSGYQRRCTHTTAIVHTETEDRVRIHTECLGSTGAVLSPFIAPSVALPVQLLGLTPRVTLLGGARGSATAIHLSAERAF